MPDMKPEWHREMKLRVISYDHNTGCHYCEAPDGSRIPIDLIVDGSLPDEWANNPESLNGCFVRVAYIHPYSFIAAEPTVTI